MPFVNEMGAWQADYTEVELDVAGASSTALARLATIEGLVVLAQDARSLRLRVPDEDSVPEIVRCLIESGARIYSVVPQQVSLEDLFLLTMGPDPGL